MPLTVTLYPGTTLWIDGHPIGVDKRTKLTFTTRVPWLGNDWVMQPEYATTRAKRLYLALQDAYVGPREGRRDAMVRAHDLAHQIGTAACLGALAQARVNQFYEALKTMRDVIQAEDQRAMASEAAQ